MSNYNTPINNINLNGFQSSFINTTDEVLLLPFFSFQVVSNIKSETTNKIIIANNEICEEIYEITLIELPYQNQLK